MRKTTVSAVRRVAELPIAVVSDIGNVRKDNQDRVAVLKVHLEPKRSFVVIALCDGMGGMASGAACASQAIASFFISCVANRNTAPSNRLMIAAQDANRAVHDLYKGNGGATLSAVLLDGTGRVIGVNIGDSRIYAYTENSLEQLSVDDTLAGLRPKANDDLRARNELLQYIGMGDGMEPHIVEKPASWDMMILTSDGAHSVDKGVMQMVIQNAKEPAIAVKRLIDIAKWCGGRDNASIAVASKTGIQQQSSDDQSLIQVWDPFGELQMVVAETPADAGIRRGPLETAPQVGQKKPQQKKRGARKPREKKTDNAKETVVDGQDKNERSEEKRPVVNIYFNEDVDKDRNA